MSKMRTNNHIDRTGHTFLRRVILIVLLFAANSLVYASPKRISPSALYFGSQAVGTASAPKVVQFTNYSSKQIRVYSIATSRSEFTFSGPALPITLGPGESLNGAVIFDPTTAQTYGGELIFTFNTGWREYAYLSGSGVGSSAPGAVVPPSVTTQPVSQTVTAGQTAGFSVAATGTGPFSYQWFKNTTAISGATSSFYTTPATASSDSGALFHVIVTNSVGSVTSASATLTVSSAPAATVPPSITTQPVSRTVSVGQTAAFSVAATGTAPFSYQWFKNTTAISGATSSSYTTPATTASDSGTLFKAIITNSVGSVTSAGATLTVSAAATSSLTVNPSSLTFGTIAIGANSTIPTTVTNSGTASVTISNVSISGAGFGAGGVSTGQILAPGQSASLSVSFTPSTNTGVSGSVTITSNATNSPTAISLSGTGVQAVPHNVALSWNASASPVTGYHVYRGQASGGPYTKLTSAPVASTSDVDGTVQSGKTYFYTVTSVDSSNIESGFSNETPAVIP
jgi:hypothetical protein